MEFPNFYKGNYKLLAIAPLLLILLSIYFLPHVKLGVEFTGGTLITFVSSQPVQQTAIEKMLTSAGLQGDVEIFSTPQGYKVEILLPQDEEFSQAENLKEVFATQSQDVEQAAYLAAADPTKQHIYEQKQSLLDATTNQMFALAKSPEKAEQYNSTSALRTAFMQAYTRVYSNYQQRITAPLTTQFSVNMLSIQTVSPTLSVHFIDVAQKVILASAVLCIIFVFLFFRTIVPSIAVIIGAFCDVLIALGAMGLFGIHITLPSFAALLMLVGFSLDTDILLTTRMLKRKGDPRDNAHDAMKTGITMSATAIIAFGVLFLLAFFTHIPTYFEISSVALAGLFGDLFATWGINGVMVLFYLECEHHKEVRV